MSNDVLVIVEPTHDGSVDLAAGELIGAASEIGAPVVLTAEADHAEELGGLGARRVLVAGSPDASLADSAVAALDQIAPVAVVCSHTVRGRETAARIAARSRRALLTDATGVRLDAEGVVTDHSNFGGAYTAVAAATHSAPVVTLRPGSVDKRAQPETPEVITLEVAPSGRRCAEVTKVTPIERTSPRPDLVTADRVVAGGVSLGSEEMFEELVGGLADALGAAVGATRSAVDEGQVPYEAQIGQTGVLVSPKLYVGLGISGAVQHLVGMQTSDTIVAINNDADAPIFEIADFGIVGDVFDLVPQIIAELNARK